MVAIHKYGKNLKKSPPEPLGLLPWNFVCSIRWLSTTNFVQMMTQIWLWPTLRQGQIWSLWFLKGEKVKQCIFWKTFVVCDVREGEYECLWMSKVKVIWQPLPEITWIAGLSTLQRTFSLKRLGQFQLKFICNFLTIGELKFVQMVQITWPKIFYSRTSWPVGLLYLWSSFIQTSQDCCLSDSIPN